MKFTKEELQTIVWMCQNTSANLSSETSKSAKGLRVFSKVQSIMEKAAKAVLGIDGGRGGRS